MRLACKILAIPVALIVGAATGVIGAWAMPVGAVLLFGASVVAAVAMESQDLASVQGLAEVQPEPEPQPLLEAA